MSYKIKGLSKFNLPPLSILRMLWKQRVAVLAVWLVLIVATFVIVKKLPAVYTAQALVLVDSQKIPERYVSPAVNTDVQDRLATITQQIMSSSRLLSIIESYDLYHDERKSMVQEEIIELMHRDIKTTVERGWTGGRPGAIRVA